LCRLHTDRTGATRQISDLLKLFRNIVRAIVHHSFLNLF